MAVPDPLRRALEKIVEASDAGKASEAQRLARWLRPLLEQAVEELSSATVIRPSRRGTGEIGYSVERTQQGEVLTELRHGGKSKPFRCPRAVYEALAVVLGEADRPLLLDEIMSAVEKLVGDRPPEHQVRMALRFWMHVQPPLIARGRARYRPILPNGVSAQAKRLWDKSVQ